MRNLSSGVSFAFMYLFPIVWILALGVASFLLFFHPQVFVNGPLGTAPHSAKWVFLAMWFFGGIMSIRQGLKLKRVLLDGGTLVVSNYFHEDRIPLSAIIDVRQGRFDRTVTIELSDPNPFNGTVSFMPAGRSRVAFWKEDAIVPELRVLASLDPPSPRSVPPN